ncbi:DNA repair protein RecO [bacterium]|nr:DNA repair protein RecO [bacterium]
MTPRDAEALVARVIPFRESDRIVWLVTREAGIVHAIVPGAAKSQKRFANVFDIAHHVRLKLAKGRGELMRADSGELLSAYANLSATVAGVAAASHIVEVLRRFSVEDQAEPAMFDAAVLALEALDEGGVRGVVMRAFEARVLVEAGLAPAVDRCVACNRRIGDHAGCCYSVLRTGVVCLRCAAGHELTELRPSALHLLRKMLVAPTGELYHLPYVKADADALANILPRQIEHHIGAPLTALRYARRLPKPETMISARDEVSGDGAVQNAPDGQISSDRQTSSDGPTSSDGQTSS